MADDASSHRRRHKDRSKRDFAGLEKETRKLKSVDIADTNVRQPSPEVAILTSKVGNFISAPQVRSGQSQSDRGVPVGVPTRRTRRHPASSDVSQPRDFRTDQHAATPSTSSLTSMGFRGSPARIQSARPALSSPRAPLWCAGGVPAKAPCPDRSSLSLGSAFTVLYPTTPSEFRDSLRSEGTAGVDAAQLEAVASGRTQGWEDAPKKVVTGGRAIAQLSMSASRTRSVG